MPHCEQSSISVGLIGYKKSSRVRSRHFIKRLWASQSSEDNFYKTKVVPFEKLIHFPNFTDFERAVTFLLERIILNFKNCKKALPKFFLKPFMNFFEKLSLHAQIAV
jgi:hypothetical protein